MDSSIKENPGDNNPDASAASSYETLCGASPEVWQDSSEIGSEDYRSHEGSSAASERRHRNAFQHFVDATTTPAQLQWSFTIMCMDPLMPEALLGRLIQLNGHDRNVYVAPSEACGFHIETRELELQLMKRQELGDWRLFRRLLSGKLGGFITLLIALLIVIIGAVIWNLSSQTREIFLPYGTNATEISFTIDKDLEGTHKVVMAYVLDNFYSAYRGYFSSRPKELGSSYRCADSQKTLHDFFNIRPDWSLSFAKLPADTSSAVFPCGASSFAYFNDEVSLETVNSRNEEIKAATFDPYNYVFYAGTARPLGVTSDWIDVTSDRYRQWIQAASGKRRLIPIGAIRPLRAGEYKLVFTDSTWPAEFWNARKAVGIFELSSLGAGHKGLGMFLTIWGIVAAIITLVAALCIRKFSQREVLSTLELPASSIQQWVTQVAHTNAKTRRLVNFAMRANLRCGLADSPFDVPEKGAS